MTEEPKKQNGKIAPEHIVISSDGKRRKPRNGDESPPEKTCPRCSGLVEEDGVPVLIQRLRRAELDGMFTRWVCKECGESAKVANHQRLAELLRQVPPIEELPISRERDG